MKGTATILTAIILIVASYFIGRTTCKNRVIYETGVQIDTVIIRDTIREAYPVEKVRYIDRVETETLYLPGDTVKVAVEVPIERKIYETPDYKAEIEGFRPSLVSMELYRQTQAITQIRTVAVPDRKRWGVGIQAGYGVGLQNGQVKTFPYIGVGVSYDIIRF
jgi:hypothetical protein